MMNWLYLVIIIFLLFSNCTGKKKIPNDILSQEIMQDVLWDMICADEFVTAYIWKNDSLVNQLAESTKLYDQIFMIHKTSKEQYQNSLSYYRNHPELLKIILDSLKRKQNPEYESKPVKISEDSLFFRDTQFNDSI